MKYQQSFVVKPSGNVKGGSVQISIEPSAGDIEYFASIDVKPGWLLPTVTKKTQGSYKADPSLLLSSRWKTVGDTITIGDVVFRIHSVVAGAAGETDVAIEVTGKPMKGTAVVDTTLPNIRIRDVLARVKIPVIGDLIIEAVPAGPPSVKTMLFNWFRSFFEEMD